MRRTQKSIITELWELVCIEHCDGCSLNTCDVDTAERLGYMHWAIECFKYTGAASDQFLSLYKKLGKQFFKQAELDRQKLCAHPHIECTRCTTVIWLPDEVDYYCDSCGFKNGICKAWVNFALDMIRYECPQLETKLNFNAFGILMTKVIAKYGKVESVLWSSQTPLGTEDKTWVRTWLYLQGCKEYRDIPKSLDHSHVARILKQFKGVL